jgi:hypothetical protein
VLLHRVAGVGRMMVSAKGDGKASDVMGGLATEYKGYGDVELAQKQLEEALEGGWAGWAGGLWIACLPACAPAHRRPVTRPPVACAICRTAPFLQSCSSAASGRP